MKLIIASNNQHKISEIKEILGDKFEDILSIKEAGVDHETIEDGKTFLENALKKAREIAEITGQAALADDSGLCVNVLGGAPGVYSARFAGESDPKLRDGANNALLLKKLDGQEDRSAYFVCSVALVYPDGKEITSEGFMHGCIIENPKGNGGFGYDPIFLPAGEKRTVSEMESDEKNLISHRGNALRGLLSKI